MQERDGIACDNYIIDGLDILLDLKFFAEKYYGAAMTELGGGRLVLRFANGQKFEIALRERE